MYKSERTKGRVHGKGKPCSLSAVRTCIPAVAGKDPASRHLEEAIICWCFWKPSGESPGFVKVKNFSPCFIYPSVDHQKMGTRSIVLKTYFYQFTLFFTKTYTYTLLYMVARSIMHNRVEDGSGV